MRRELLNMQQQTRAEQEQDRASTHLLNTSTSMLVVGVGGWSVSTWVGSDKVMVVVVVGGGWN